MLGRRYTTWAIIDSYSERSNLAFDDIFGIPGITRILTRCVKGHAQDHCIYPPFSGGMNSAPEALPTLQSLCCKAQNAGDRSCVNLTILPGSGINSKTVRGVLDALLPCGLQEIHLSGGRWEDSSMAYRPEYVTLGTTDWVIWRTHEESIREVRAIADELCQSHTSISPGS
jgi:copper homeostasis protein